MYMRLASQPPQNPALMFSAPISAFSQKRDDADAIGIEKKRQRTVCRRSSIKESLRKKASTCLGKLQNQRASRLNIMQ